MILDDELKYVFLLCTLPSSWDTFCTIVSNSNPNGKLVYNDIICGTLLSEEIHRKSMTTHNGDAYNVCEFGSRKN